MKQSTKSAKAMTDCQLQYEREQLETLIPYAQARLDAIQREARRRHQRGTTGPSCVTTAIGPTDGPL
jgi:hypothetical protein